MYPLALFNIPLSIDGSASANSTAVDTKNARSVSVQVKWSGGSTPVGSFSIAASNDGTIFTVISGSAQAVSGNSGSLSWDYPGTGYAYFQAQYTRTSGSATFTTTFNGKN